MTSTPNQANDSGFDSRSNEQKILKATMRVGVERLNGCTSYGVLGIVEEGRDV